MSYGLCSVIESPNGGDTMTTAPRSAGTTSSGSCAISAPGSHSRRGSPAGGRAPYPLRLRGCGSVATGRRAVTPVLALRVTPYAVRWDRRPPQPVLRGQGSRLKAIFTAGLAPTFWPDAVATVRGAS